uniref:RNA-dependent RNA polymerase n=1 Tax=Panagrolaimus sp. JU765 TaxID=591449 RepID=A0AC34QYJ1_9BILA
MPLDFSWENHGLEPMHETLRNCSAFIFAIGGNLSSLKEMLILARITLKSEFIIVEHFPIEKYQALPQNENYYVEMLKSLGYPGKYLLCKNYFVIKTSSSEDMVNMWYHVMKDRSLRDYFPLISYIRMFPIHGKYIIRKVIITPTRRILTPPTQTPFCPIFRHVDHKKIIEVSFEDDDGNVMFGSKRLSPLARYTCSNGIEIAGEIYHEFGSSNSKFCKRGSYFYRGSKEEILSILKTLGKFERALPAKIAARIGLNFTSVLEEFITEKQQVNIPDNLGRTALGAADFHGYLKPGQVFFRYSKEVDAYCEEKLVHVGPIAITRSPTLSLGDIQFVEAVDVPELHHIVDVLIFPTCGDRPIQDKISSGDLDGDEYFIFWDPELLLPYSQPPSEFTHPMPSRFDTIEIDQIQDHFPKFREEYMQKDNVGAISNSLTVFGELLGYDNLNVRRLAEKVDIALTYFKTGILAPNLEPHELSLFDPNHMLKEWKPMYSLKNVIGSFYDINGINVLEIQEILESDCSKPKMDELIDFPGWEKWKARAYMNFTTFKIEIDVLLCQNHLKSIGELFSNRIFKYLIRGQDIENLSAISPAGFTQKLIYDLTKKNREQALMKFIPGFTQFLAFKQNGFSSIYPPGILDDLKKYAVACYKIAYEDGKYLAFPWILWDVIDNVRSANKLQSTVGSINIPLEKLSISDNQSEIPPELQKIMDNFQKHCSTPLTDKEMCC